MNSLPLLREQYLSALIGGNLTREEAEVGAARFEPAFRDDPYQAVVMFHMETHPTDQPAVAVELLPVSFAAAGDGPASGTVPLGDHFESSEPHCHHRMECGPIRKPHRLGGGALCSGSPSLGYHGDCGVGRACRNFMELPGSRRDSLAAVEYKAIAGEGRAYYYGDLQSVEWEPFDWDRRREERFLFAIKYGTQEQIDAALRSL